MARSKAGPAAGRGGGGLSSVGGRTGSLFGDRDFGLRGDLGDVIGLPGTSNFGRASRAARRSFTDLSAFGGRGDPDLSVGGSRTFGAGGFQDPGRAIAEINSILGRIDRRAEDLRVSSAVGMPDTIRDQRRRERTRNAPALEQLGEARSFFQRQRQRLQAFSDAQRSESMVRATARASAHHGFDRETAAAAGVDLGPGGGALEDSRQAMDARLSAGGIRGDVRRSLIAAMGFEESPALTGVGTFGVAGSVKPFSLAATGMRAGTTLGSLMAGGPLAALAAAGMPNQFDTVNEALEALGLAEFDLGVEPTFSEQFTQRARSRRAAGAALSAPQQLAADFFDFQRAREERQAFERANRGADDTVQPVQQTPRESPDSAQPLTGGNRASRPRGRGRFRLVPGQGEEIDVDLLRTNRQARIEAGLIPAPPRVLKRTQRPRPLI